MRKAFWFLVVLAFCVLTVFSVVGIIAAPDIISIFRKDDLMVTQVGALSLQLQCIVFPLSAFIVAANMMLQTIGMPVRASLSAISRNGLFFVPAILILPGIFDLLGVQMSQAIADVLSFVLCIFLVRPVLRQMKRMETEGTANDAGK